MPSYLSNLVCLIRSTIRVARSPLGKIQQTIDNNFQQGYGYSSVLLSKGSAGGIGLRLQPVPFYLAILSMGRPRFPLD